MKSKVIPLYLLMLFCHVAHVFEEIWGNFFMVMRLGLGRFLIVNLILLIFPLLALFFVMQGRRWAYALATVYAVMMTVNGLGHNIMTVVTGRYFGGSAGGFSGIALVAVGVPLVYYLRQAMLAP